MAYGTVENMRFQIMRSQSPGSSVVAAPQHVQSSVLQGRAPLIVSRGRTASPNPASNTEHAAVLSPRASQAGQAFFTSPRGLISSVPLLAAPVKSPSCTATVSTCADSSSAEDIRGASKDPSAGCLSPSGVSPTAAPGATSTTLDTESSTGPVRPRPVRMDSKALDMSAQRSTTSIVSVESSMSIAAMVSPRTLKLATEGASPEYRQQAAEILKYDDAALMAAYGTDGFADAMKRQGVILADLRATSKLSLKRRERLLAAVLQDMDLAADMSAQQLAMESTPSSPRLSPRPGSPSSTYKEHIQRKQTKSLEKMWQNAQHRLRVAERQDSARRAQSERSANKKEEEQRQVRRAQERAALDGAARRLRSESRDGKWRTAIARASEIESSRKNDRAGFCESQSQRSRQRMEQNSEEVASRKQLLRNRFELVEGSIRRAYQEQEMKAQMQAAKIQQKMTRSADHLESCRLNLELKQQEKRDAEQERQHQILRMKRLKDYQRFVRLEERSKDDSIFNDCRKDRERMQSLLTFAAERSAECTAIGISAPEPESLTSFRDIPISPRSPGRTTTP